VSDTPTPADPLSLAELFAGGGEPWLPVLKPLLERRPAAELFIGPNRGPQVVPVRELTFQALKPNPPHKWRVVVFGQNPYPRAESATGIAMFDNTFHTWADSRFGKVPTTRCMIKAAAIWKHGISPKTAIADLRRLLADQKTVLPPEWFQAMLTQGVLLLNAALTASSDGAMSTDQHTEFWRPVAEAVAEHILRAKAEAGEADRGVVFAWWGTHARALRAVVERVQAKYPAVKVRHIAHSNPAAQGDLFCQGNHFAAVNAAVTAVGGTPIDWLPTAGWDKLHATAGGGEADRMGAFIADTMELHKQYLERLESVKDEGQAELAPISGVFDGPLLSFADAMGPVGAVLSGLAGYVKHAAEYGRKKAGTSGVGALTADEVAAVHLYTCESAFYRQMNATLRSPDRTRITPYFGYLRLLFSALGKMSGRTDPLWRGVRLDLRGQYPAGKTVTWWGVSSCTSKVEVAKAFMGWGGRRTLFEITPTHAVGIRHLSAFTGEEEFLLPPGTQLRVTGVTSEKGGLSTVKLQQVAEAGMVR
jgi:uracil DNA glycosylase